MFYNYSNKDFTYTWGNKPFTFKSGEVYNGIIISDDGTTPLQLNEITSRFFSKHLAEHLLNNLTSINFIEKADGNVHATQGFPLKYNITNMETLIERGITAPSVATPLPSFAKELELDPALQAKKEEPKKDEPVVSEVIVDEAEQPKKKLGRPKKELTPSENAVFEGV